MSSTAPSPGQNKVKIGESKAKKYCQPELAKPESGDPKIKGIEQRPATSLPLKIQSEEVLRKLTIQEDEQTASSTLTAKNPVEDDRKRTASPQDEQKLGPTKKKRRGGKKRNERYHRWVARLLDDDPRKAEEVQRIQRNKEITKIRQERYRIKKEIEERNEWIMKCESVDVQMKGELDNLVSNPFLRTIVIQRNEQSSSPSPTLKNQSADDTSKLVIQENEPNPVSAPALKNQSEPADDLRSLSIQEEEKKREVAYEICRIEKEVKGKQDWIMACEVSVDMEEMMDNVIWDM